MGSGVRMTTSKPDVQALIEEAKRMRKELQQGASFHETVGQNAPTAERMRRAATCLNAVTTALSALSGETETEWGVSRDQCSPVSSREVAEREIARQEKRKLHPKLVRRQVTPWEVVV